MKAKRITPTTAILTICAASCAVLIGTLATFTGGNAQGGQVLVPRWIGGVPADPYEFAEPITVTEFIEGDEGTRNHVLHALSQVDAEYSLQRIVPPPRTEQDESRYQYMEMFGDAPRIAVVTSKDHAAAVGTQLANAVALRGRLNIGFGKFRSSWTTELGLIKVPTEGKPPSMEDIADEVVLKWSSEEIARLQQFVGNAELVSASYTFRLLRQDGKQVECLDLFLTLDSDEGISTGWFQLIGDTMDSYSESTKDRTLKLVAVHPGPIFLVVTALNSDGEPIRGQRVRF